MNLAKLVSIGIALVLIQACSHPIEIVGEGDVTAASGNRNCSLEDFQTEQDKCTKNYVVGAYQETYYATPRDGYVFERWVDYCPDAQPPNYDCVFDIPAATVQQFWGQTMPPLKAVFRLIVTPITGDDIVRVDGKEWAQPALFGGVTWIEINDLCRDGPCQYGSVLKGKDMTGWTWAGATEMAALFNSYGVTPPLQATLGSSVSGDGEYGAEFFGSGWRPTFHYYQPGWRGEDHTDSNTVGGWTIDTVNALASANYTRRICSYFVPFSCSYPDGYKNQYSLNVYSVPLFNIAPLGAWFYR